MVQGETDALLAALELRAIQLTVLERNHVRNTAKECPAGAGAGAGTNAASRSRRSSGAGAEAAEARETRGPTAPANSTGSTEPGGDSFGPGTHDTTRARPEPAVTPAPAPAPAPTPAPTLAPSSTVAGRLVLYDTTAHDVVNATHQKIRKLIDLGAFAVTYTYAGTRHTLYATGVSLVVLEAAATPAPTRPGSTVAANYTHAKSSDDGSELSGFEITAVAVGGCFICVVLGFLVSIVCNKGDAKHGNKVAPKVTTDAETRHSPDREQDGATSAWESDSGGSDEDGSDEDGSDEGGSDKGGGSNGGSSKVGTGSAGPDGGGSKGEGGAKDVGKKKTPGKVAAGNKNEAPGTLRADASGIASLDRRPASATTASNHGAAHDEHDGPPLELATQPPTAASTPVKSPEARLLADWSAPNAAAESRELLPEPEPEPELLPALPAKGRAVTLTDGERGCSSTDEPGVPANTATARPAGARGTPDTPPAAPALQPAAAQAARPGLAPLGGSKLPSLARSTPGRGLPPIGGGRGLPQLQGQRQSGTATTEL